MTLFKLPTVLAAAPLLALSKPGFDPLGTFTRFGAVGMMKLAVESGL